MGRAADGDKRVVSKRYRETEQEYKLRRVEEKQSEQRAALFICLRCRELASWQTQSWSSRLGRRGQVRDDRRRGEVDLQLAACGTSVGIGR